MKKKVYDFLDVDPKEGPRVVLLLIMSFFMGVFIATFSVASQSLFLQTFKNPSDLPQGLFVSGAFGLVATVLYNFLQNRIPFQWLATGSIVVITLLTAFVEFGQSFFPDVRTIYFFGYAALLPFSFIILLIFWGAFARLFNLRQSKKLLGNVDQGGMIASFIAFFLIPQFLKLGHPDDLYTISLISISAFLVCFIFLSVKFLNRTRSFAEEKVLNQKLSFTDFFKNRYVLYMSLFVITSMIAVGFVEYSFLSVSNIYNQGKDPKALAEFLAYFEMTIVIFAFLFDNFAQDRIIKEYGMRVSLLINPILVCFFTITALGLGSAFGYRAEDNFFVIFFIVIAASKLFLRTLKDTIDETTFKLYLLPIESNTRIDVQTKITGTITALASLLGGGLIFAITMVESFSLLTVTAFTIPFFVGWYFVTNKMHVSYKQTLESTLTKNKEKTKSKRQREYALATVLEKEVNSSIEEKVIYSLRLMEKLEPALFENSLVRLSESESKKIRIFVDEKLKQLELNNASKSEIRSLAENAASGAMDSDLLSISPEKLIRLSKSGKQSDRVLAAKLLTKLVGPKTIFVMLELLRDVDPKVRYEALYTARKVARPETWPVLIELLGAPSYSHLAAAALREFGEKALHSLELAFHKSGQSDIVMLRIVQVMGKIGGRHALTLLWKKADFPDKRIVKQILFSLRYINYRAEAKEARDVFHLLEAEMSKTIWNLAALHELPPTEKFHFLREALQEEVADNYDQIFMLLSIVYDQQNIQMVRENLETHDPDNIAFAMELLDLFLDAELKPKLIPLLDESPTPEKLKLLQLFFPREEYTPIQVINYILNRDFNFNNRWTKVCAIHASAFIDDFRISRGLVAQMFNGDKLLQETAAWVVYNKDKSLFARITERLPARDKRFLDSSIENNRLLDGLNDGFFLFIEMIMFIKQSHAFRNIHGLLISDLGDKITPLDIEFGHQVKFNPEDPNPPLFIVAHGEVKLYSEQGQVSVLKRGNVYGEIFTNGPVAKVSSIVATERSIVFKINLMDFYFVMASHHELVQGLIRNITEKDFSTEQVKTV
jgi:ATP:ADP antiporter, AAA family